MTVLVFGRTGQVATELQRLLPDAVFLGRADADLTDAAAVAAAIAGRDCDAVINVAAYTAVDKAESDAETARLVNAGAPGAMARAAAEKGIPFLHVSTDYVFDGTGEDARKPDDPTGPLGVYGATKLAGEQAVLAAGGCSAIMRTSWVFSAHGANFVKTMLRLGAERTELNVVADQIGGSTPAADIAAALVIMARDLTKGQGGGVYHFAGAPDCSWADFAREIFRQAGLSCHVNDIPTEAYPTPAKRPRNSRLDCSGIAADFGILRPDWREGLERVLTELKETT